MRPEKNSDTVKIPLTFDFKSKGFNDSSGKMILIILIFVFWIITSLIALFKFSLILKILYPLLSLIFFINVIRFLILRELYFRKKRKELLDNQYLFKHTVFWNICDISDTYPYVAQFANNLKGIFVVFKNSEIISKGEDGMFEHHEALGESYRELSRRNISFRHIDYMDSVGKDDRMNNHFSKLDKIENTDLKELLTIIFDNMQYEMKNYYACYDAYCFYFKGRTDLFFDDLKIILDKMLLANYEEYTILDKNGISDLVKKTFNIDEFSATNTSNEIFKSVVETNFITVIWTENNGVRTRINQTSEELKEFKRTSIEEHKAQKQLKKKTKKFKRNKKLNLFINKFLKKPISIKENNEEIILFEDDETEKNTSLEFDNDILQTEDDIIVETEDDDIIIENKYEGNDDI
ncbi:hypothetical protein [Clostridioides difficile]|uniref:hypothetical protein n=1 Tax=Clostridioides difficile TaxID=1496 RepID=UPI00103500B3|nr:hypothetical protein [Clostridioides difficile]MDM9943999.1 hypothetical protein [Clostridioides difficile]